MLSFPTPQTLFPTLLAAALLGPLPSMAQVAEEGEPDRIVFHGQVLNGTTGQPVAGAAVYLPDPNLGYFTRENGAFRIPDLPRGHYTVEVERLGYVTLAVELELTDSSIRVDFELEPQPVILEGLEVVVDRFERRRRGAATSVRVLDEDRLRTSSAWDALEAVQHATGFYPVPCPRHYREWDCIISRGRPVPPSVYIDEAPAVGGLNQLAIYQPHDFYLVEIYARGRHIRAYTHGFMERAARMRLSPIPFFF